MHFYIVESPKLDSPEGRAGRIDVMKPEKGVNRSPAPRCPSCDRPLGSRIWLPPYRLEIKTLGKHWGDITRTGNNLIISERFKDAFEQTGLKGLDRFEPVEVTKVTHCHGKLKEPMPVYLKAPVSRGSTAIDQQASGFVWEDESRICPECLFDSKADLRRCKRLEIDQGTWNGDDIFFPRGALSVIVSERFRSMFQEHELHGAIFIPSESDEAGYDSFPWETDSNQG